MREWGGRGLDIIRAQRKVSVAVNSCGEHLSV